MAERCCICGEKIGFGSAGKVVAGLDGFYFCISCVNRLKELGNGTSDEMERAALLIMKHMCSGEVDPKVVAWLNAHYPNMAEIESQRREAAEKAKRVREEKEAEKARRLSFVTSGCSFERYRIAAYHGPVTGDVAANLVDLTDGSPETIAEKVSQARQAALDILIDRAHEAGGNAVIGLDYDYVNLKGFIGFAVNGTSVTVVRETDSEQKSSVQ